MAIRKKSEIEEYMQDTWDKVWYGRSQTSDMEELEKIRLKNVEKLILKFGLDELNKVKDPVNGNYNFGYVCGILSALRWVLGEEKYLIDD